MKGKQSFAQHVVEVDECVREIASLDDLYNDLVNEKADAGKELVIRREEAKFARERILKLSLHAKNLLTKLESHETLK